MAGVEQGWTRAELRERKEEEMREREEEEMREKGGRRGEGEKAYVGEGDGGRKCKGEIRCEKGWMDDT
jgi:hypothetical protein